MFKLLGSHNRVVYAVLLSTVMLAGCQPDPKEGTTVEKPVDDSSEMTEIKDVEVTAIEKGVPENNEEGIPEDNNETNLNTKSDAKVKPSSDKVDLERRTSAIVIKEPATPNKKTATTNNAEVSIENDRVKPENLFDYANAVKYAEGYTQTIYPKSGKQPTFAGYPVVSFDTLYFEKWIGCCPRHTNDLLLADVETGNKQQLEDYANKNECEVSDVSSEEMERTYMPEDREIPQADNYMLLACYMSDG